MPPWKNPVLSKAVRWCFCELPPVRLMWVLALLTGTLLIAGCKTSLISSPSHFSRFIGLDDFSGFTCGRDSSDHRVLLSPFIKSPISWNELIVSWNAEAPIGTGLKVEAAGISAGHRTGFYTLGEWSPDAVIFPRTSLGRQRNADGTVNTDTLELNQPASAVQIRLTLEGTNAALPKLRFLSLSFSNTKAHTVLPRPETAARAREIATPERSQHGYPGNAGWCSPTCLSMVLARWAQVLDRPELDLTVPQVAAAVYDRDYRGTGNWSFNTAFAGSFAGLRSYVTRFDDLSEVEAWIASGIPVILSARWDWLEPGRPPSPEGHLIVCRGFTENGDVVVNEPAAHLDRGETVRRVYRRENVRRAWAASGNTVYLVYPENATVPPDRLGHW